MPALHIILDEPSWPDLAGRDDVIHVTSDLSVAGLAGGMSSGKASVAFRLDLPDGRPVVAETSLALLVFAARGLAAKFDPSLFEAPKPTAEIIHAALIGLVPAGFAVSTSTAIVKGRSLAVATVQDLGPPTEPVRVVLTAEAASLTEALSNLFEKVVANLKQHDEEGHDAGSQPVH